MDSNFERIATRQCGVDFKEPSSEKLLIKKYFPFFVVKSERVFNRAVSGILSVIPLVVDVRKSISSGNYIFFPKSLTVSSSILCDLSSDGGVYQSQTFENRFLPELSFLFEVTNSIAKYNLGPTFRWRSILVLEVRKQISSGTYIFSPKSLTVSPRLLRQDLSSNSSYPNQEQQKVPVQMHFQGIKTFNIWNGSIYFLITLYFLDLVRK